MEAWKAFCGTVSLSSVCKESRHKGAFVIKEKKDVGLQLRIWGP